MLHGDAEHVSVTEVCALNFLILMLDVELGLKHVLHVSHAVLKFFCHVDVLLVAQDHLHAL